jgi:hypothetical protein
VDRNVVSAARAFRSHTLRIVEERANDSHLGIVRSVKPIEIETTSARLVFEEDELILSDALRQHDSNIGIAIGDTVLMTPVRSGEWVVTAIMSQDDAPRRQPKGEYLEGTSPPSSGTYARGDKVWNTEPSDGDFIGWTCISGGTPGVWLGFGGIGSGSVGLAKVAIRSRQYTITTTAQVIVDAGSIVEGLSASVLNSGAVIVLMGGDDQQTFPMGAGASIEVDAKFGEKLYAKTSSGSCIVDVILSGMP